MYTFEKSQINAIKSEFSQYSQLIKLKIDAQKRLTFLRSEIAGIEKRMTSRKRPRDKDGNLIDLKPVLAERLVAEKKILYEIQDRTLHIERLVADVTPNLTPLELILVIKLYIEGLSWKETIALLQDDPTYSQFCYERTTYMRAHKSAFAKILAIENGHINEEGDK